MRAGQPARPRDTVLTADKRRLVMGHGMVWIAAAAQLAGAPVAEAPAGTPERAAADFVAAFNAADASRFDTFWSEGATLFWPGAGVNGGWRIEGKSALLAAFHTMFARLRAERPGPQYLNIRPLDLHVQRLGATAIVSFHLGAAGGVSRRTIVMQREGDAWRIVHLHGSFAPSEAPPR